MLVTEILPRGVLCIERNSVGDSIIDHLMNGPARDRLYFDKAKDLVENNSTAMGTIESVLKRQASIKSYYGVYTSPKSRDDMVAILARHVNEYKDKFVTKNIIRDLSRLVRTSSGKIEAGPGFHDDSIMSYLIALYVYYHGNNLAVFGIIKGIQEDTEKNKGLKRADEIDPTLVSPDLIAAVKNQEILEAQQNEWTNLMRKATIQAQKDTYRLQKAGEVQNTIFEHTPGAVIEDIEDDGRVDLSIFNNLNGF